MSHGGLLRIPGTAVLDDTGPACAGPGKREEGPRFAPGGCEFLQSTQKWDRISEEQSRDSFLLPLGWCHRFGYGSAKDWVWGGFGSFITIFRKGKRP